MKGEKRQVHLLCGFESLHLATFLKAHLRLRFPEEGFSVRSGLYGDLEGNIRRASQESTADGAVVVLEWSDLDPRLGFRNSARWDVSTPAEIVLEVGERCNRLLDCLRPLAAIMPVTIVSPSINLPSLTYLPPIQTSSYELELNAILLRLLQQLCRIRGVKLLSASGLAISSPQANRHDIKMDLQIGFPYTLAHADILAELATNCLFPASPKKGLITDLDQTLWKGILGDVGVDGVSWSLERKAQSHTLYQKILSSLAASGTLVAIASKNDPKLVDAALARPDLLLSASQIFPIEASWGIKSEAVGRILEAWNVDEDSVVFVDDSPMELAEVAEKYPRMEVLRFPSEDPGGILALLHQLRLRFGKEEIRQEDRLRIESLRTSSLAGKEAGEELETFIKRLNAKVTIETSRSGDTRALELVNKTNQFNLNGKRYTEVEWRSRQARVGAFLILVSYEDRFGPLGRIGVLSGLRKDDIYLVEAWVMSCRAFSRQIEFETLEFLFAKAGAGEVIFEFTPTERNLPLQRFLSPFFPATDLKNQRLTLDLTTFRKFSPPLLHEVIDQWTT